MAISCGTSPRRSDSWTCGLLRQVQVNNTFHTPEAHPRYQGRLDSSQREELVSKREARDAIDALLTDNPVAVENTPAVGCSTKWAYKEAGATWSTWTD